MVDEIARSMIGESRFSGTMATRGRARQGGSVLIAVLAVMVFLGGLLASYSLECRQELQASRNYRDGAAARFLARAGIEVAVQEISLPRTRLVRDADGELFHLRTARTREEEISAARRFRSGVEYGDGWYAFSIRSAREKPDVNKLNADMLHRLLELACGVEEGPDRTSLVNSILDWRDANDTAGVNGAEDDYYDALDPPRSCKNADFDMLEELLLVRGVTEEILYGDPKNPPAPREDGLSAGGGLAAHVSVGSGLAVVDETSSDEEIYILTGRRPIPEDERDEETEDAEFDEYGVRDVRQAPRMFRITAWGWVRGGSARHCITALVSGKGTAVWVHEWTDNDTTAAATLPPGARNEPQSTEEAP